MWMQHIEVSDDPDDDPWENDSLSCRKEEGLQLTKLIENIEHPFVLSVSGPWGSGKTTFIEMWKQHLQNEGFHCLYFNAWRNDFVSDPLIALVGEMELDTKELKPALREKLKGKIDSLKTVAKVIVRHGLPAVVEKLSGIDVEAIADALSESFETYEKEKESLKTFRENLQEYAVLVRADSEHPLVFFVDELDRCRPTYAVEFLERIKHLFDVDNVIFILALASGQLEASIKALYGDDTDSARYLRRMIDLSYELRIPSAKAYMPVLLEAFEIHKLENWTDYSELRNAAKVLGTVADAFRLSLREQQQAIAHLAIILRIAGEKLEYMELASLMFLLGLRMRDSKALEVLFENRKVADSISYWYGKIKPDQSRNSNRIERSLVDVLHAFTDAFCLETEKARSDRVDEISGDVDVHPSPPIMPYKEALYHWLMGYWGFLQDVAGLVKLTKAFEV